MSGSIWTSPRKRQKHGGGGGGGANTDDDRISDLPDSIIGNILSYLPTNNAVATGILSKRWKLLWTLADNLDFRCPKNYTGSVEQFVEFVNHVLLFHKRGCFKSLSLAWETGCIPNYVNTWIGAALDMDVSALFVRAPISKLPIQVQSSLFSSESLRSLELNCSICISTSDFVINLPRLERLKLISVYFQNDKAIGKILTGCPVLKYLIIHMDAVKMVQHGYLVDDDVVDEEDLVICGYAMNPDSSGISCVLSSASLTHLEISVDAFNSSPRPLNVSWSVELDVPSLRYIKLDGFILSISVQPKTLALFDEANIQINGPLFSIDIDGLAYFDRKVYCNNLAQAFSAFSCAKTLILHDQVIRILSFANFEMKTVFKRLTRLELSIDCSYWSSLLDFLMFSDNLEVLIVHKYGGLEPDDVHHDNNSNANETDDLVPRCLSKSLQRVSVGGYYGHRDELAMIEYIIKHASVLRFMEIGFGASIANDLERKCEVIQEICAFPRKSTICEVTFTYIGPSTGKM